MEKYTILKNLDPMEIQTYQQNRFPCFFVDKIEEAVPGKSAKGYKNFTYNEWFFPAHFADEPNVPGFVQIETLAQVFLMTFLTLPENRGKKAAAVMSKAQFKKKIVPGDKLEIEAELFSYSRGLAKGKAVGYLNSEFACSAELTVAIPDIMNSFVPKAE